MLIFKNYKIAHRFIDLYETLSESNKKKFGAALRKEADRKMTDEDNLDDYHLTSSDIDRIHSSM